MKRITFSHLPSKLKLIGVSLLIASFAGIFSCNKNEAKPKAIDFEDEKVCNDFVENYRLLLASVQSDPLKEAYKENKGKGKIELQNKLAEVGGNTPEYKAYTEHTSYIEKTYSISKLSKEERMEVMNKTVRLAMKRGIRINPYFMKTMKGKEEGFKKTSYKMSFFEEKNPIVKKSDWLFAQESSTPCSDQYSASETEIGVLILGTTFACWGMGGATFPALICWATVAAIVYGADDYLQNQWCECMISHYGGCVY